MSKMRVRHAFWLKTHKAFLVLLLVYILVPLTLDVFGDYGLKDDPAYAWSARRFVETGRYQWNGWSSMSLVGQIWLVGPIAKVVGPSYGVLRLFTLAMGLICLLSIYLIAVSLGCSPLASCLLSAGLYVNPVFFPLVFSFMTDIPSLALGFLGLLLSVVAIRKGSTPIFLLAGAIWAYSILIRESNILWSLALLAYLAVERGDTRRYLPWAMLLVAVNVLVFLCYSRWSAALGVERPSFAALSVFEPRRIIWAALVSLAYTGMAVLPFVAGKGPSLLKSSPRWLLAACMFGMLGLVIAGTQILKPGYASMPYSDNGTFDSIVVLSDRLLGSMPVAFGPISRIIMTVLSAFAAAIVLAICAEGALRIAKARYRSILVTQRRVLVVRKAVFVLAFLLSSALLFLSVAQRSTMEMMRRWVYVLKSVEVGERVDVIHLPAREMAMNLAAYRMGLVFLLLLVLALWALWFNLRRGAPLEAPSKEESRNLHLHRLVYFTAAAQGLAAYMAGMVFDRYLLAILPAAGLLLVRRVPWPAKQSNWPILSVILLYGMLSWGLTHDVMAWSRARDRICDRWLESGVRPADIEAGFVWNADHASLPLPPPSRRVQVPNARVLAPWLFPGKTGRYTVAYEKLSGYSVVSETTYVSVVPPKRHRVYGLRWMEDRARRSKPSLGGRGQP